MDSKEQLEGQRRVRDLLIVPLLRLGLAKPSTLTKDQFEAMQDELCAKLASMKPLNLSALSDVIAKNPAGKDKDRFPIATAILDWAAQIQPPRDDASPLIRAVFAEKVGCDAMDEGWSPELLFRLRRERRWPTPYVIGQIKDDARDAIRRLEGLDSTVARGGDLRPSDESWRNRRRAALDNCRQIAALSGEGV